MSPTSPHPMLAEFFSGVALLSILFVPLLVLNWREFIQWWRELIR